MFHKKQRGLRGDENTAAGAYSFLQDTPALPAAAFDRQKMMS
jgi:hypothetical protein